MPLPKKLVKLVTKTYYQCVVCSHWSQNKDSTYRHTCHNLNVTLAYSWPKCNKSYEAPEGFKDHVNKKHRGEVAPPTLSKEEAEAVVFGLSLAKRLFLFYVTMLLTYV